MIDKLIEEVDENKDGEIQFEEFCAMMKKLTIWVVKWTPSSTNTLGYWMELLNAL